MGWDRDAQVTAVEAALHLHDVTRHLIYMWVRLGKLSPVGRRGRSPLYRWGDIIDVERDTRGTPNSARKASRLLAA